MHSLVEDSFSEKNCKNLYEIQYGQYVEAWELGSEIHDTGFGARDE